MPRYRFRLADGQTHETTMSVAALRRAYPDAVITHRVEELPNGEAALQPYTSEKAMPTQEPPPDYESQKVAELLVLAQDRGIALPTSSKKADVIAALQADDAHEERQ